MEFKENQSKEKNKLFLDSFYTSLFFEGTHKIITEIVFFNKDTEIKMNSVENLTSLMRKNGFQSIEFEQNISVKRKDKRDKPFYLMKDEDKNYWRSDNYYILFLNMDKLGIELINIQTIKRLDMYYNEYIMRINELEFVFDIFKENNLEEIKKNNLEKIDEHIKVLEELKEEVNLMRKDIENNKLTERYYVSTYVLKQELNQIKELRNSKNN